MPPAARKQACAQCCMSMRTPASRRQSCRSCNTAPPAPPPPQIRAAYPGAAIVLVTFPPEQQLAGVQMLPTLAIYQHFMAAAATELQKSGVGNVHSLQARLALGGWEEAPTGAALRRPWHAEGRPVCWREGSSA